MLGPFTAPTNYFAPEYEQSPPQANRALGIDPDYSQAFAHSRGLCEGRGEDKAARLSNGLSMTRCVVIYVIPTKYYKAGLRGVRVNPGTSEKTLRITRAPATSSDAATDYAFLGEKDAAFAVLDRTSDANSIRHWIICAPIRACCSVATNRVAAVIAPT